MRRWPDNSPPVPRCRDIAFTSIILNYLESDLGPFSCDMRDSFHFEAARGNHYYSKDDSVITTSACVF